MNEEGAHARHVTLVRQILRYLVRHPAAKDTAEGVLKWWLTEQCVEDNREAVQETLDCMVSEGWLTERETRPSGRLYGLGNKSLAEMRAFLAAGDRDPKRYDA